MDNYNLEGYESPITMIVRKNTTKILEEREDAIVARISEELGFDINKGELIKALMYDRNQYSRGYDDGYRRAQSIFERPQGEWIDEGQYAEGHSEHAYSCKNCGYHIIELPNTIFENQFCKHCGADMRGKE